MASSALSCHFGNGESEEADAGAKRSPESAEALDESGSS